MTARDLVVWQLTDGKRGHERQVEGLIAALRDRVAIDHRCIRLETDRMRQYVDALRRRFSAGRDLPRPDLIIGAGRGTHWPLIAARRAYAGRSVCLMRPGLPHSWFDLCIIPRHDRPRPSPHVVVSDGPLNPMRPAPEKSPRLGLILIGGPSTHYAWDSAAVVDQIRRIVGAETDFDWQISDSRRTPRDFATLLTTFSELRSRYVPFTDCAPGWLQENLARAARAWVSADSIAMIYEALSAAASVAIIDVPIRRHDRISAVACELGARGWVGTLDNAIPISPPLLNEATRCADLLLARWPDLADGTH